VPGANQHTGPPALFRAPSRSRICGNTAWRKLSPAGSARMRPAASCDCGPSPHQRRLSAGLSGPVPQLVPLIRLAGKCSFSPAPPPGCGRIGPPTSGHLRLLWAGRLVLYGSGNWPKSRLVPLGAGPVRPLPPLCRHESRSRSPGWAILRLSYPPAALNRSHSRVLPVPAGLRPVPPRSPGRCLRQPVWLSVRSFMAAGSGHNDNNTNYPAKEKVILCSLCRKLETLYFKGFPPGLGDQ